MDLRIARTMIKFIGGWGLFIHVRECEGDLRDRKFLVRISSGFPIFAILFSQEMDLDRGRNKRGAWLNLMAKRSNFLSLAYNIFAHFSFAVFAVYSIRGSNPRPSA